MMRSLAIVFLSFLASANLALAASSEWQDLGGGKARLVLSADPSNSSINGVIEVKLEKGWSTYWRYPGSSGIPPRFDFSASKGFSNQPVKFPTPALQTADGISYAGYKRNVSFPFSGIGSLAPDMVVKLNMLIGVCREVCIPAIAEFEVSGRDLLQSDPVATEIISVANKTLPISKAPTELDLSVIPKSNNRYEVTINHASTAKDVTMFIEGPDKWRLLPSKRLQQIDDQHVFELNLANAPDNIDPIGGKIDYTFAFDSVGIEIRP